jgi:hypothetical protein
MFTNNHKNCILKETYVTYLKSDGKMQLNGFNFTSARNEGARQWQLMNK